MSDNINKDNINNNLSDDGTEKPLEHGNTSEPEKVVSENVDAENVENNVNNIEEIIPEKSQELLETGKIPVLLNSVESNELLESGDSQLLLKAGDDIQDSDKENADNIKTIDENVSADNNVEKVSKENTEDAKEVINKEEIETANSKDSNYQVSLIDERILKVRTSTNESVSIDCNLFIKEEVQSNKILIHPKAENQKQEIEVVVKIGDAETPIVENTEESSEESVVETAPSKKKLESSYQVSLINENVLRIKISTNKSVSVDCSILDKTSNEEGEETQTNKIFIKPKFGIGKQDVAIFIKIGSATYKETDNTGASLSTIKKSEPFHQSKLIPNPLVADLIQKFSKPKEVINDVDIDALTPEEKLDLKIGRKNPWRQNKEFLATNLYRGFVAANIIAIVVMIVFYAFASKKPKEDEVIEQRRLIVMQDLPENLNQQNQNVDDPNKPEPPKVDNSTDGSNVTPPVITPKKIKPPKVNLPKYTPVNKDTNDTSINKELDSLRKKNITGNNGNKDTGAVNTSLMADSLLKNLSENEVGLAGKFPPNWKQIDARTINMKDDFRGILLVDTTAKSKEEALNMFIELDAKGEKFNQFQFKRVFDEDSLRTVYALDPKQEGKLTYYRFYVATKTDNVFVNTFVVQSAFEKYKPEIERVVKTVRIQKPEKK